MLNLTIICDETPWNTLEKISVPRKSALISVFKQYKYTYGTQEHWNTIHYKSRMRILQSIFCFFLFKFAELCVLVFQSLISNSIMVFL